jgi:hypothetical protein
VSALAPSPNLSLTCTLHAFAAFSLRSDAGEKSLFTKLRLGRATQRRLVQLCCSPGRSVAVVLWSWCDTSAQIEKHETLVNWREPRACKATGYACVCARACECVRVHVRA